MFGFILVFCLDLMYFGEKMVMSEGEGGGWMLTGL